jgi:hypothetical protein
MYISFCVPSSFKQFFKSEFYQKAISFCVRVKYHVTGLSHERYDLRARFKY